MEAPWRGFALPLEGGQTLLSREASVLVAHALDAVSRIEKIPLSPAARDVRSACLLGASQAGIGQTDVRSQAVSAVSEQWISTSEVSDQLQVSQRQALRLVTEVKAFGEPRKRKGRWYVPAAEVAAYAAERRAG